ncbi:tetratricopeptide repeat protein [Catellatospora sp. IY07-71]|uniref:tetratricopeptide repeat protein n=1 Tax=Catellatospora sp. IY07-71 TaxID=2728827 RepID=UPI001BB3AC2B|nr:tetratricopeptide repeat protein [Catellatospora sp. IY07-71]
MDVRLNPVVQFCHDLRVHWQASGRDLPGIARQVGISRTQLYAILNGEIKRPPDFAATVRPFLLACGATDAELAEWRRRHDVLVGVHQGLTQQSRLRPAPPNLLPAMSGSFVGRTALLTALDTATSPAVVTGPPGVGKTALVLHWAYGRAASFPDGRLYADLRGYARDGGALDPADVIRGFLDALGVPAREIPPDPAAQAARFRSLAADRRLLVVLDNARDAGQVRPLLAGGSGVRTVVTSRNPLTALVAEYAATPVAVGLPTEAEAVELVRSRLAGAADDSTAADAVAACGRLPLALALIAARVSQSGFALATAAAEVRQAGSRTHHDLHTVFSWSYAAVSPPAARLFRLLGLPAGPDIAADAAAALAGVHDAGESLDELVQAGLLVEHRPHRYLLHDLLRGYAREQAHATDTDAERRAALTRLLGHYTSTAHEADRVLNPIRAPIPLPVPPSPGSRRPDYQTALTWLKAERAVLLATLRQAGDDGLDRHAWQLGWALDTFLYEDHRWHDEGAAWAVALRAATASIDDAAAAHAHRFLGAVAGRLDRFADAYAHMHDSMRLCRAAGDLAGEAETEFVLSYVCFLQDDVTTALAHAERSLELWTGLSDLAWTGRAANAVGLYHAFRADAPAAIRCFQRAADLQHQAGDVANEAVTRDNLGKAHHAAGAYLAAVAQFDTAGDLARQLGDPVIEAQAAHHAGDAFQALGDHGTARERWEHAYKLLDDAGHPMANDVARKLAVPRPGDAPGSAQE